MPAWEIYFLRTAFTILLLLAIILRYFIKGYVVKNPVKFFKNKTTAQLYQNNQKWIDKVVVILYCIIIGYVFYSGMIPLLKDYPLLRDKKYNTITCSYIITYNPLIFTLYVYRYILFFLHRQCIIKINLHYIITDIFKKPKIR